MFFKPSAYNFSRVDIIGCTHRLMNHQIISTLFYNPEIDMMRAFEKFIPIIILKAVIY